MLLSKPKAKQDIIESAFYDDEKGYGSKLNTLKYAKQINKNINYLKNW